MWVIEALALILCAILICAPLSIAASRGSGVNVSDWIDVLTLTVLAFQAIIFDRQTNLFEKQATLAHQTYLQTNRPRLRVRNITLNHGNLWVMGQFVAGEFYVENIGGTNAIIVESYCGVVWGISALPMRRPYEGHTKGFEINNPIRTGAIIIAGDSLPGIFRSSAAYDRGDAPNPAARGFVMGWIDYKDDNGIRRRMAFCREFVNQGGAGRFVSVQDTDYEHEG